MLKYNKNSYTMKNNILIFMFLCLLANVSSFAQTSRQSIDTTDIASGFQLVSDDGNDIIVKYTLSSYTTDTITAPRGTARVIGINGGSRMLIKGAPDLPKISASIIIQSNDSMQVEVTSYEYSELDSMEIAPSKGNIKRTKNPSDIPFVYGNEYETDVFFPEDIAVTGSPYNLREITGQAVTVFPFQYNAVTKKLRVYSEISLKITSVNNKTATSKTISCTDIVYSGIYENHFLNYSSRCNSKRYTSVPEQGNMLIITDSAYTEVLQPFTQWKIQKGISTEVIEYQTLGSSTAIKKYVSDYYKKKGLTFLLLVGDEENVPSYKKDLTDASNASCDPAYGHITGSDAYAEVIVGRFSAETVAQAETQIQRSIDYEKNPRSDDWYNKYTMIASDEGPGDDGEYDYQHLRNIKYDLLDYIYTEGDELYDGDQGEEDERGDPATRMLINALDDGRGFVNYIGHGAYNCISTTDFYTDNVQSLNNQNNLPFFIIVACNNGEFDGQTCLAEQLMRATSNDNPTGAVNVFASSIEQDWNPPMAAQDEMIDILVETYSNNIKRTFGGIVTNGCMLMNDEYPDMGYNMTNTWTIFGDPSLEIRTDKPDTLRVSHVDSLDIGQEQYTVNSDTEDAYVCLTQNSEIIGAGVCEDGSVTIELEQLTCTDPVTLTVTAYNSVPYISSLKVYIDNGAYLTVNSVEISDINGNDNSEADYGEDITIQFDLNNPGNSPASGIQLVLESSDTYITITDSTFSISSIGAETSVTVESAFGISITDNIPDQYKPGFTVLLTDINDSTWTYDFSIPVNAPGIEIDSLEIDDAEGNGNCRFDPGESVLLKIMVYNAGNASPSSGICYLETSSDYLQIEESSHQVDWESGIVSFNVSVSEDTPVAAAIDMTFSVVSGNYGDTVTFTERSGLLVENWETGDFSRFDWEMSGNADWTIIQSGKYKGKYAAKSGSINNFQSSELDLEVYVLSDDSISFYKKISSEDGYDYLVFYIDGNLTDYWSGEVDWSRETYTVDAGEHTFTWIYQKDEIESSGDDCAYLDEIVLPVIDTTNNSIPEIISKPVTQCDLFAVYSYNIELSDADEDDTITVVSSDLPSWLTIYSTGNTTFRVTGIAEEAGLYNPEIVFTDGIVTVTEEYPLIVGGNPEDWETGDFTKFDWTNEDTSPWTITENTVFEGNYSAKSGNIINNRQSELSIIISAESNDSILFCKKVSSEEGYDYLEFYIDDELIDEWSGESDWSLEKYDITAGDHTLSWIYSKDNIESDGSDCAWIDFIVFPYAECGATPEFTSEPVEEATENLLYSYNITVSDDDGNDEITISCTVKPGWLTFEDKGSGEAVLYGTPAYDDFGDSSVVIAADDGCNTETEQQFYIYINLLTGIEEVSDLPRVSVYPNPVSNTAYIDFLSSDCDEFSVQLYNAYFQIINNISYSEYISDGQYRVTIDATELKSGVYFCRISYNNTAIIKKLIVVK